MWAARTMWRQRWAVASLIEAVGLVYNSSMWGMQDSHHDHVSEQSSRT